MSTPNRRQIQGERRSVPRGGRRPGDQPGRHPNLLVADSYEGARIPCVRYLDRFGFRVDQAADGNEALASIATRPPHLILIEDGLPKVSGWRMLRRLKDQPQTRSIPVIVMTSDFDAAGRQASQIDAAGVLVKPFALSTMLQEIRRVLREQSPSSAEPDLTTT
jgi:two-component system phosphate regulon response regulator PhoB